jgi:hypothetical protein
MPQTGAARNARTRALYHTERLAHPRGRKDARHPLSFPGAPGRRMRGGGCSMAFEDLMAELSLLLNEMENQPEDITELYLQIHEKLNEMRAFGMPLPADLVELERRIEAEMEAGRPG